MGERKGKVYIGTSGFYYKHWMDKFYPKTIHADELLEYYAINFHTVELNTTFYRLPNEDTFKNWEQIVPDNFLFSLKASRILTHGKKLTDGKEFWENFIDRASILKDKLGPILFQLPPSLKANPERLEHFIEFLPKEFRYTFEFRNDSWEIENIFEILRKYNVAFCIYEFAHHITPMKTTADFVYVRLHGPEGKYAGLYSDAALSEWAATINEWKEDGKDVYCYFDNDQNAYAAYNAASLSEMIR